MFDDKSVLDAETADGSAAQEIGQKAVQENFVVYLELFILLLLLLLQLLLLLLLHLILLLLLLLLHLIPLLLLLRLPLLLLFRETFKNKKLLSCISVYRYCEGSAQ